MQISLFETENDLFVLKCNGFFNKPLKAVHFDKNDHFLSLSFEGLIQKEQLDCYLPEELQEKLIHHKFMAIGFYEGETLKNVQLVPLLVYNYYEKKDFIN